MIIYIIKYLILYINKPTFTCIYLPYINKYKHKTIQIYKTIYLYIPLYTNIEYYAYQYKYILT